MNPVGHLPWQGLLPPPPAGAPAVRFPGWLLCKHGEPLLWIPRNPTLGRQVLTLYPAQTRLARWARRLASWALQWPRPPGLRRLDLTVAAEAPFLVDLLTGANCSPQHARFGLLCGNPRAPGRRFIFLRFGPTGTPDAVIKAGDNPAAHERLEAEANFLQTHNPQRLHAPPVQTVWRQGGLQAMVQPYVPGDRPTPSAALRLDRVLSKWIEPENQLPVPALPLWSDLGRLMRDFPPNLSRSFIDPLATLQVHPTLVHGDFAPWNLRFEPGSGECWVLDWERGRDGGLAGWDWAYYVVQESLMVRRWAPQRVAMALEQWLEQPEVRAYLALGGTDSTRRAVVLSGLWYHYLHWRPTERAEEWAALLGLLHHRWNRP